MDRSKLISFANTVDEGTKFVPTKKELADTSQRPPKHSSRFKQVGFQQEGLAAEANLIPDIDLEDSRQKEADATLLQDDKKDRDLPSSDSIPQLENEDQAPENFLDTNPTSDSLNLVLDSDGQTLSLDRVLESVANSYPEIEIAIGEIESAAGKVLASWGEFDRVASAFSISQPLGFYQTYRNGAGIRRPVYSGGEVSLDYRLGDGNFEPWYGERETNEGGEIKAGFLYPLLKDREIDARRAKLLSAGALQQEVQADVEARLLLFQRFATQAYWDWVAAGKAVKVQKDLLTLAQDRVSTLNKRIRKDDVARVAILGNNAFIAKRENDRIKAEQAFIKTAIKLSLFNRDANGVPRKPGLDQLPPEFPGATPVEAAQILQDTQSALSLRPEFAALRALRQSVCIDARFAENLTLPKLDVKGFAGQDLGGETSSKGDKTPFEFQVGVFAELPLERRKGLGQLQVARGKLAQIDAKVQFLSDKVRAEVQDAAAAINAAYQQILQSERGVDQARKTLEISKKQFEAGDIDLIALNLVETLVADTQFQLIDAQFKYFVSKAVYETAISGQAFSEIGIPESGVPANNTLPVNAIPGL